MDVANKWTLLAEEARSNLIAIKHNYHGQLTDDPLQRALVIPTVLFTATPITEDYSRLSFLVPNTSKAEYPKWSQISRIRAMIHNYNNVQDLWCSVMKLKDRLKKKW